jgi:hypothetical protein
MAVGCTVDMVTYLPSIHGVTPAREFVALWMQALGDRAAMMREDARLTLCASEHAIYLANRSDMTPSMHIGRNNSTPNERLAASGYKMPDWWSLDRNNCEACSVHHGDERISSPLGALELMIDSPAHRPLVLGERVNDWFWHLHTVWGAGNAGPFYVLVVCTEEL